MTPAQEECGQEPTRGTLGRSKLADYCQDHAQRQAPFLTEAGGSTITYGDCLVGVDVLDEMFRDVGVGAGDRVLLFPGVHDWLLVPAFLAAVRNGALLAPLSPRAPRDSVLEFCRRLAPKLVLADPDVPLPKPTGGQRFFRVDELRARIEARLKSPGETLATRDEPPDDPARPSLMICPHNPPPVSGAMLTEESLVTVASAIASCYGITEDDSIAKLTSYHHVHAISLAAFLPVVSGARLVVPSGGEVTPAERFRTVVETGASIVVLPPGLVYELVHADLGGEEKAFGERVRFGLCAGEPLPASVWQRFEQKFQFRIYQGWGLAETAGWVTGVMPDSHPDYSSVGIPLVGDVRIRKDRSFNAESLTADRRSRFEADARTRESPLGRVQVRSPALMTGYYKSPRGKKSLTSDGYWTTEQIGFISPRGTLNVVGRADDVVVRDGAQVAVNTVDQILQMRDEVAICKTVGLGDDEVGYRIVTAYVPTPDATASAEDLHAWLCAHLPPGHRPDRTEAIGRIPRDAGGTLSLATLRAILSGAAADYVCSQLTARCWVRFPPSEPEELRRRVDAALREGSPIKFACYWGCGGRTELNSADEDSLLRIRDHAAVAKVADNFEVTVTIVLQDIHARVNHVDPASAATYFRAIAERASELGLDTMYASEVWDEYGLKLAEVFNEVETPEFAEKWASLGPIVDRLIHQSEKHSHRVERDPEYNAQLYHAACQLERPVFASKFCEHIWMTYAQPEMDAYVPDLPKLRTYSWRKGRVEPPWFVW